MELEGVYVAQIISQLKMRSLIPVIRELRLAMDRRSFFGVLDKYFPVDGKVARNIVEYIINVSENDGDMDFSPTGYFVMDDDGNWKDLPHQDSCPRVKINAQRIGWLKEWADEKSEKMGENVDKLYEFSEDENKIIEKAIAKGMLKRDGDRYKWLLLNKRGKPSKADLAYFCGRLFCGDYVKESKRVLDYKMGGDKDFPEKTIEWLFSVRNIRQSRNQLGKMKKKTDNQKKIDGLFE